VLGDGTESWLWQDVAGDEYDEIVEDIKDEAHGARHTLPWLLSHRMCTLLIIADCTPR